MSTACCSSVLDCKLHRRDHRPASVVRYRQSCGRKKSDQVRVCTGEEYADIVKAVPGDLPLHGLHQFGIPSYRLLAVRDDLPRRRQQLKVIVCSLPNSPTTAKFLRNGNDRLIAVDRLRENNTGTKASKFKWDQFKETYRDPKTYMYVDCHHH